MIVGELLRVVTDVRESASEKSQTHAGCTDRTSVRTLHVTCKSRATMMSIGVSLITSEGLAGRSDTA